MPDPVLLAIATTLATKTSEALVEGGKAALISLGGLVRRRFAGQPADTAALEAAQAAPSDATIAALAAALDGACRQDTVFDRAIREQWSGQQQVTASGDAVVNVASGNVGKLIQGRDFNGTINL